MIKNLCVCVYILMNSQLLEDGQLCFIGGKVANKG